MHGERQACKRADCGRCRGINLLGRQEVARNLHFLCIGSLETEGYCMVGARYDDLIHIRAGIAEVRRASLVFVYNVMDAERKTLLAEGMTEHACTGRDGRPVRPPEWFVKLMRGEPFQIPE